MDVVEMDFLRRACQISRTEHIRNEDIRRKTGKVFTTIDNIETRQLVWYGHVMRAGEDRWPKRAIEYAPRNRRRRGRPVISWEEGIRKTMRDRAIRDDEWQNREKWRSKCGMRQRL